MQYVIAIRVQLESYRKMIVIYAILAVVALLLLPFSHVLGVLIVAAILFAVFHVPPVVVIGIYLVFHLLRWILPILGLAWLISLFSRGNGSDS